MNKLGVVIACAAVGLLFALGASASVYASGVRAQKAYDFIDVIGVSTHHDRSSYDDVFEELKAAYQELGIRYIRGGGNPNSLNRRAIQELYNDLGIRLVANVVTHDCAAGTIASHSKIANYVDGMLSIAGPDAILAFEGVNEHDSCKEEIPNWADQVRDTQEFLYNYVKGKDNGVKVVGPPLAHWGSAEIDAYTSRNIGDFADFGSSHIYVAGFWNGSLEDRLLPALDAHRQIYGTKPIFNTEFGHCTGGQDVCQSESSAAKRVVQYVATLFLQDPRHKAFFYEATDRGTRNEWGLLRSDNSRKPAFYALRNLIRILKDDDPNYTPGQLEYSIDGAEAPTRQLLLQKKDGRFYLLLWMAVPVWNPATRTDIDNARDVVTLRLANPATLRVFEPGDPHNDIANRDQPLETYTNVTEVDLGVPDHLMIVEIDGGH